MTVTKKEAAHIVEKLFDEIYSLRKLYNQSIDSANMWMNSYCDIKGVKPEYRMQLVHIDEKEDSCDIARRKKLMKYIEEPDNDIIRREKRCDKFYEALDKITQEWNLQR